MFRRLALPFVLFASLVFFTHPANATNGREFVLDNGLKVLLLEDHKSPAVTFQVWYRVGSRNERDGKSRLAHFLEHMMFKGTPTTKPEEYSRMIAKNGGRSNAFTTSDVTVGKQWCLTCHNGVTMVSDLPKSTNSSAVLG